MLEFLLAAMAMAAPLPVECPTGLFKSGDGLQQVVLTTRPNGVYRYTFVDGRRGDVGADESPLSCSAGSLLTKSDGARWSPVPLRLTELSFESHGTKLAGTLVEPPGTGPHPLVVLVHGSERTSPMASAYPLIYAAQGMSVFAYDKRGTAKSEGEYTQNFELLADDAAAAMAEARRAAAGRFDRIGYFGGSQGGWVAPLAATRSNPDFVAIGFGLIVSPLEEDREQILSEMREMGYGAADQAEARQVADATGRLVASHFTTGFDQLTEVKRRYGAKPWLGKIKGEYTGAILTENEAELRRVGRSLYDNLELIWDYDAPAVIRRVKAPQLWALAEDDREAPSGTTLAWLEQIRAKGSNLTIYSFPATDHGMIEFTQAADGTRSYTRITDGYFRLLADWIKGLPLTTYGRGRKR